MGILQDKKLLISGVLTDTSLAFAIAKLAEQEGAEIILTGAGRGLSLTERTAKKLLSQPQVLELDITSAEHIQQVGKEIKKQWGHLDAALHSIAFAPESCLGGNFMSAPWEDVSVALEISAFSLKSFAGLCVPLMDKGGSILGLDFDASKAWPVYDWMGVSKAALESTSRYLAKELGEKQIRVNLLAAGPIRTIAAKSIPGFTAFEDAWAQRAPLGWDVNDSTPVAKTAVALLSDWFPATTGEIIHADGGYHAIGA